MTNRQLLQRYGSGTWTESEYDAIYAEVMRRPSDTCEDGTTADADLTGFDQPDLWFADVH